MTFKRYAAPAFIAAAALALTGCASNEGGSTAGGSTEGAASGLSGTLNGAGASSQGSAQEAWIASFQTANPDVTINYDPSGSGAGRETFIAGGSDFAGSDAYLKDEELESEFASCAPDSQAIDLPLYISPIAVIFNVEGVDELNLDAATLAGIFKGDITNWNAPEIAALNEGVTLPDAPITAVHRSDDSGTTENFAEYLAANAPEVWDAEPDGEWAYPTGEGAQGTSGVVDAVTNGTNTIGYADASRAGDLGIVKVKVGEEFVSYSPEAAAAIVDASPMAEGRPDNDIAIDLDRTLSQSGTYPIVLVSYLIACQTYADAEKAELVKSYLGYIASEEGQQEAAAAAGIAPITEDLRTKIMASIESIS